MVTPTYPGVYVEEVPSGVRPITGASTSTAAFIGQAQKGSLTEAVRIFNFTQFQNLYGDFMLGSYLAHAVFQFFNNGGSQCYIVRVGSDSALPANIVINDRVTAPGTPQPSLTIEAESPGVWGNSIEVRITDGKNQPGNEFNLEVFVEGDSTPRETFDNMSMVRDIPNFADAVVSTSNYVRVTVNTGNTNAVAGTSVAFAAPVLPPLPGETQLRINIDGDGYQTIDLQTAVGAGVVDALDTPAKVVSALNAVVQGDTGAGLPGLSKVRASTDQAAFDNFQAALEGGVLKLSSGTAKAGSSVNVAPAPDGVDITGYLKLGQLESGVETLGGAVMRPVANTDPPPDTAIPRYFVGDHDIAVAPVASVQSGSDGPAITTDLPYTQAFSRLDNIDDVSLIAVPGIGSPTVVSAGMNYCEGRSLSDCFFVGDMPQDVDEVGEAHNFVSNLSPKNSYGAVYIPWLFTLDPTGASAEPIAIPPSGFVAGLYAKTDAKRGVWKAPAGTEAAIAGATGLVTNLTDVEHGLLNPDPYNINVIRQFAASGRVIWGARTQTTDAEYRYVPIRRIVIMLRVSIYRGIQWAVFEPNDEELWSQLRLNIGSFMTILFRRGAFQGATPKQAFFVKCDSETTTQNDIDQGIVNVLVGFAPLKPAEFMVVKISQKAGQSS